MTTAGAGMDVRGHTPDIHPAGGTAAPPATPTARAGPPASRGGRRGAGRHGGHGADAPGRRAVAARPGLPGRHRQPAPVPGPPQARRRAGEDRQGRRGGARGPRAAFPDMAPAAQADVTAGRLRGMPGLRGAPVGRRTGPRRFPPGSESPIRKGRSRGCWRNRPPPSAGMTGGPGRLSGAPGIPPQATRSWPRCRASARSRRRPRSPGWAGRARPPAARPRRRAAWRRSPAAAGRSGAGATWAADAGVRGTCRAWRRWRPACPARR